MVLKFLVIVVAAIIPFFLIEEPTPLEKPLFYPQNQKQLNNKIKNVLNDDGSLSDFGYSDENRKIVNFDKAVPFFHKDLTYLRIKKWDCYIFFTDSLFIQVVYADLGYIHSSFTHVFDFKKNILSSMSYDVFSNKANLTDASFNLKGKYNISSPFYSLKVSNSPFALHLKTTSHTLNVVAYN